MRSDVAADPMTANRLRREFDGWLCSDLCLPDDRRHDIALAVYEAIINAVEHAYRAVAPPHTIKVDAHYDAASCTLEVTVIDHGRWRRPRPDVRRRGRGLVLMEGLADNIEIDTTAAGTRAEMQWQSVSGPVCTPSAAQLRAR